MPLIVIVTQFEKNVIITNKKPFQMTIPLPTQLPTQGMCFLSKEFNSYHHVSFIQTLFKFWFTKMYLPFKLIISHWNP